MVQHLNPHHTREHKLEPRLAELLLTNPKLKAEIDGLKPSLTGHRAVLDAKRKREEREAALASDQALRPDDHKVGPAVGSDGKKATELKVGDDVKQRMHQETVAEVSTGGRARVKDASNGALAAVVQDASQGSINPISDKTGIKEFDMANSKGANVGLASLGTFTAQFAQRAPQPSAEAQMILG